MALGNIGHEGTTADLGVQVMSGYTVDTSPPQFPFDDCSTTTVELDPSDGEVWLAHNCESTPANVLVGTFSGDTLVGGDIELYLDD